MKKQKTEAKINLEALAGGAFAEKLNEALIQVADNIQNPNTEATTKRQINVTIKLVDCIRITSEFVATLSADELALGDYTLGRYAWKLANVQKLPEPIPAKGRQGLWNWEACLLLRHKGRDSWERPVYEDETGKLWKDVEPRADDGPKLCSALYNAFDGEPDTPLEVMERYKDKAIIFIPKRDTWTW